MSGTSFLFVNDDGNGNGNTDDADDADDGHDEDDCLAKVMISLKTFATFAHIK